MKRGIGQKKGLGWGRAKFMTLPILQMEKLRLREDSSSECHQFPLTSVHYPTPARATGNSVLSNSLSRGRAGAGGVNGALIVRGCRESRDKDLWLVSRGP